MSLSLIPSTVVGLDTKDVCCFSNTVLDVAQQVPVTGTPILGWLTGLESDNVPLMVVMGKAFIYLLRISGAYLTVLKLAMLYKQ